MPAAIDREMEFDSVLADSFPTVESVLEHKTFIKYLGKVIGDVTSKHVGRAEPPAGFKYKRTAIDRMYESRTLTVTHFTDHIGDIWHKVSNLPSSERDVIREVCNRALSLTVESIVMERHAAKQVEEAKEVKAE